jgi:hypothetical protein
MRYIQNEWSGQHAAIRTEIAVTRILDKTKRIHTRKTRSEKQKPKSGGLKFSSADAN